jgi:valyl-tRNA synthetase
VHGLVRDGEGQKMSKSKGNVLDPIDLIDGIDLEALVNKRTGGMMQPQLAARIEKATRRQFPEGIDAYGTDALRFTYYSLASTGRDIKFDIGRIEGYRNFCNKIWNAARYVLMNCENRDCGADDSAEVELGAADRWIIGRLQETEAAVERAVQQYRFDLATQAIYGFVWNEYCDWYLELSKPVLGDDDASEAAQRGTRRTLIRVLESWLRLLHPFMPFITEEIWQAVAPTAGREGPSIMLQPYPRADLERVDSAANAAIEWLQDFVQSVRNIRGEMSIPPGKTLTVLLRDGTARDRDYVQEMAALIAPLARVENPQWLAAGEDAPASATGLCGDLEILVPLAGVIDLDEELARLQREIDRIEGEIKRLDGKLANEQFVARAPEAVVAKERQKLDEQRQSLARLVDQKAYIGTI